MNIFEYANHSQQKFSSYQLIHIKLLPTINLQIPNGDQLFYQIKFLIHFWQHGEPMLKKNHIIVINLKQKVK